MRKPELSGRMAKWSVHLSGYDLEFESRTAIKSRATRTLCRLTQRLRTRAEQDILNLEEDKGEQVWELHMDGASNAKGAGVGLVLKSPQGDLIVQAVRCEFKATNNEAEYEALILGLKLALDLKIRRLQVCSDSKLIVNHVNDCYEARDPRMMAYLDVAKELKNRFVTNSSEENTPDWRKPYLDWLQNDILPAYKKEKSTPRNPQSNGQAESSNKIIVENLKKKLEEIRGKWAEELPLVLWADRTTPKVEMASSLDTIDELRTSAQIRMASYRQTVARSYNKNVKVRTLQVGDLVLRKVFQNTKNQQVGKFAYNWEGPYKVESAVGNGAYRLVTLEGQMVPRSWNITHLKKYFT
ncbi:uncharacterized protein LOC141632713 [Silene latifolia]|uniref:uncharacterized protein LOC141632713 n=1 Tax=Silene latifolia TaxID=37657 RepID=UPI003D774356